MYSSPYKLCSRAGSWDAPRFIIKNRCFLYLSPLSSYCFFMYIIFAYLLYFIFNTCNNKDWLGCFRLTIYIKKEKNNSVANSVWHWYHLEYKWWSVIARVSYPLLLFISAPLRFHISFLYCLRSYEYVSRKNNYAVESHTLLYFHMAKVCKASGESSVSQISFLLYWLQISIFIVL